MNWKTALIIFFVIIILGFLSALFYYSSQIRNFQTQNKDTVDFEIKKGEGFVIIVDNLSKENIIDKPLILKLYLFISGDAKKLQAGSYEIEPSLTLQELVQKFVKGKVSENKLVILEGWRLAQIEEALAKKGMVSQIEFNKASNLDYSVLDEFKQLDPKFTGKALEGFIFPDTYRFTKDDKASDILKTCFENFKKQTSNFQLLQKSNFSPYDVLILASIVEREVKSFSDRKLVASVFINRLKRGMKLEADPTVQYAKDEDWPKITSSDYQNIDSPYNTYRNLGLPPTPICSPSLSSIKAVVEAPESSYIYFFNTQDGKTIFSEEFKEHLEKQKSVN